MRGVHRTWFQNKEPGAIGAHDLRLRDPQVDFGMAARAITPVAGDCIGFDMNYFGWGLGAGVVHLSCLAVVSPRP